MSILAQTGGEDPAPEVDLTDLGEWWRVIADTVEDLWATFLANLPLIVIGLVIFMVGWFVASRVSRGAVSLVERSRADATLQALIGQLVRIGLIVVVALLALAVSGVDVGAALAGLGIAGLALAFALQGILENFVAGILLLIRKPFEIGDQIATNDFEGTVEEVDLRVTRLSDYDGETIVIPNKDVFSNALVNYTRRDKRRSRVTIGVDYRDDHNEARRVISDAMQDVDGVLQDPAPQVLLAELGGSSVNFEVRYWTGPDIGTVRQVQDRVLADLKSAVEGAGMSIPWPMRTLVFDNELHLARNEDTA